MASCAADLLVAARTLQSSNSQPQRSCLHAHGVACLAQRDVMQAQSLADAVARATVQNQAVGASYNLFSRACAFVLLLLALSPSLSALLSVSTRWMTCQAHMAAGPQSFSPCLVYFVSRSRPPAVLCAAPAVKENRMINIETAANASSVYEARCLAILSASRSASAASSPSHLLCRVAVPFAALLPSLFRVRAVRVASALDSLYSASDRESSVSTICCLFAFSLLAAPRPCFPAPHALTSRRPFVLCVRSARSGAGGPAQSR